MNTPSNYSKSRFLPGGLGKQHTHTRVRSRSSTKIRNACSHPFVFSLLKEHRLIEKSSAPRVGRRETDRGGGFEKEKRKRIRFGGVYIFMRVLSLSNNYCNGKDNVPVSRKEKRKMLSSRGVAWIEVDSSTEGLNCSFESRRKNTFGIVSSLPETAPRSSRTSVTEREKV